MEVLTFRTSRVHFSRSMAAQPTPPSILREFCPLYYLLNAIPSKVLTCSLQNQAKTPG